MAVKIDKLALAYYLGLLNNHLSIHEYSVFFFFSHCAHYTGGFTRFHGFTAATPQQHRRGSQNQAESRDRQWATGAGLGELLSGSPNQPMIYL